MTIDPRDNSLLSAWDCLHFCLSYTSIMSSRAFHRGSSVSFFVPESLLCFFLFLVTRVLRSTWPRGGWLQWLAWQPSITDAGERSARTMCRYWQRKQRVKSLLGSPLPFPTLQGTRLDTTSIPCDLYWVCQLVPKGLVWLKHSERSWSTVL